MVDRSPTGYRLGYARVSTLEQDPELRHDALEVAGAERIFADQASGALTERPQLSVLLEHLRPTAERLTTALRMLAEGRPKSAVAATVGVSRATAYAHLSRLE